MKTKLYEKRDDFPFFIVRMSNFHNNIPSSIFYGTMVSGIFRIEKSSSSLAIFYEKKQCIINKNGKARWNR